MTPLGAEVIESQDNWNYSRSVLFGYAIPFYHMGLRATLPVTDKLSFAGYLVNGWNNSSEIHGDFPCVGLTATVKPGPKLTWIANYMGGTETEGGDTRHIFDTTLTVSPDVEAEPPGQLRLRQGGRRRAGGASRPTRRSRSSRAGRSSAATSTSTTRTAAS